MKITITKIGKALAKTCAKLQPPDQKKAITVALHFIQQKKIRKDWHKFLAAFYKTWKEENETVDAELTTATTLETENIEQYKKILSDRLQKKVFLKTTIDPSLLGGTILKIDDKRIDGSLKTRLHDLATTLKQ